MPATKRKINKKKPAASTSSRSKVNTGKVDPELLKQAKRVVKQLKKDFPEVECALVYKTPFQLLIATILSAQCTDVRVNIVTKDLFKKYKTAAAFAKAPVKDLEKAVHSTGFYKNKAKNIKACSQQLVEDHNGKVPQDLDELVTLAGVGRKTANVVLGTAFGIPTGVVVDTHVGRLSRRLGLTKNKDAVKAERDLTAILPQKEWIDYSHRLIYHGRQVCSSRKPKCDICSMKKFCPQIDV